MPGPLSGPGIGLQPNQYLYPSELYGAPVDVSTNRIGLAQGQEIPLPAGDWYVDLGLYCVGQFLDVTANQWVTGPSAAFAGGMAFIKSDGFNFRVGNLLGCPIGAIMTNGGTGYTQATATITPSVGNSVWSPVIGGALTISAIANAGLGYGVPPLILIPAPPGPSSNPNGVGGVAATAWAVITNGSISAVSMWNQGAGYPSAPVVTVVPNPTDPNINSITTPATLAATVIGSGTMTAAICTNSGAALTNAQVNATLTLTPAGTAGTAATLSAVVMQTVVSLVTVSAAGAGYPNVNKLTTVGGVPTSSVLLSSSSFTRAWKPRPADITLAAGTGAITTISALNDGGLFLSAPSPIIVGNGPITTIAVLSLQMGSVADSITIQNAP